MRYKTYRCMSIAFLPPSAEVVPKAKIPPVAQHLQLLLYLATANQITLYPLHDVYYTEACSLFSTPISRQTGPKNRKTLDVGVPVQWFSPTLCTVFFLFYPSHELPPPRQCFHPSSTDLECVITGMSLADSTDGPVIIADVHTGVSRALPSTTAALD